MIPAQGMASLGEHVLKNTVSPYNQISQGYTRDDDRGGVLGALRASAWEQVGVSEPTDRAQKFEQGIERFNARTRRQRTKRPEGVLPDLLNRFTQ